MSKLMVDRVLKSIEHFTFVDLVSFSAAIQFVLLLKAPILTICIWIINIFWITTSITSIECND